MFSNQVAKRINYCALLLMALFIMTPAFAQSTQPADIQDAEVAKKVAAQPKAVGDLVYEQKNIVRMRRGDEGSRVVGSIAFKIYKDKKTGNIDCVSELRSTFRVPSRGFKGYTKYIKQKDGSYRLMKGWTELYLGENLLMTGTFDVKAAHVNIETWLHYDEDNQLKLPVAAYEASTVNETIDGPAVTRFDSYAMPYFLFNKHGETAPILTVQFPASPSAGDVFNTGRKVIMTRRPGSKAGQVIFEVRPPDSDTARLQIEYDAKGRILKVVEDETIEITPEAGPAATQPATAPATQPGT